MKIFVYDYGWEGATIIVAETPEEARAMLIANSPSIPEYEAKRRAELQATWSREKRPDLYDETIDITIPKVKEFEIKHGLVIETEGE